MHYWLHFKASYQTYRMRRKLIKVLKAIHDIREVSREGINKIKQL